MTARIRILPDHVANQIAAGEVVERPASVVKELVENALDAGATRVEVALRNGGKTEIRVSDDGHGMNRQDALLALDRHATSKIADVGDLQSISSFGFRGEALPSIAAVSRFQLDTAIEDGEGTRVRVREGRILNAEEIARRRGTTVIVRSLFQSIPVRAKFLKTAAAETRAASDALLLLALSNLDVAFRLESNGRRLLDVPPVDRLGDRVAAVWGEGRAGSLIALDFEHKGLRLGGLIERPGSATRRSGRRYLFVNGRPIRDPGLARLVDEAYRTTVAQGVRPDFFLYLSVPSPAVDVNIHPAKAEVRFHDRVWVEQAVRDAIHDRLADLTSVPPLGRAAAVAERRPGPKAGGPVPGDGPAPPGADDSGRESGTERPQLALFVRGDDRESLAATDPRGLEELKPARPELWQLHRRYILASTREGLLIIDQHSAHERILYEEIMRRFESGGGESQRLLFPVTLRLSPAEYSAAVELAGMLQRVGFEIDPFAERTLILRATPHPHSHFDGERCLRDMIRELTEGSPLVNSARNQHERIAKSMACKGAIKAGQALSGEEMAGLFDRLFATELPGHDVHGRPTIVRLALDELDRRFGRS